MKENIWGLPKCDPLLGRIKVLGSVNWELSGAVAKIFYFYSPA